MTLSQKLYDDIYNEYVLSHKPQYFMQNDEDNRFAIDVINNHEAVRKCLDFANCNDINITMTVEKDDSDRAILIQKMPDYIFITCRIAKSICIRKGAYNKYEPDILVYRNKIQIMIADSGACVTFINDKHYPSGFADFRFLPDELRNIIFSAIFETYIWKDFIADNFYPTIKIADLQKYHNKKDYFEDIFDKTLPSNINKKRCQLIYAACCIQDYVCSTGFYNLLPSNNTIPDDECSICSDAETAVLNFNYSKRNKKDIAVAYITAMICDRMKRQNINIDDSIVRDYVRMSIEYKNPIDMQISKKKLYALHNEMSVRAIKNSLRGVKLKIPDTPLKFLQLPKNEFVLLNTKNALITEGRINHNCVASYIKDVNAGRCIIYSADINNEHLTLEIRYRKLKNGYKFYVAQCRKNYNKVCSQDMLDYINQVLNDCSENAIKAYNKKIVQK